MTLHAVFCNFLPMENYLIAFLVSYLIGSLPTAYLVVKAATNVDIRTVGSGNVGGRNALEVTGKKWIGSFVVAVDMLKGALGIIIVKLIFPHDLGALSIAMSSLALGHCYPIWLKFQGGRGLATAAGVFLLMSWVWNVVWLILYFSFEKLMRNVHAASVIALAATPVVLWFMPNRVLNLITPSDFSVEHFFVAATLVIAVCLSRHIEPLKKLAQEKS